MSSTPTRISSRDLSRPSTPVIGRRLPFPGSQEASWRLYRDRVENAMLSRGFRTAAAFFIFGLMNNILYVIVLSVLSLSLSHLKTYCGRLLWILLGQLFPRA